MPLKIPKEVLLKRSQETLKRLREQGKLKENKEARKYPRRYPEGYYEISPAWANIIYTETLPVLKEVHKAIKEGYRPIILLPDTSMRVVSYFINTLLIKLYPEVFLEGWKKGLPFQATAHIYAGHDENKSTERSKDTVEIPGFVSKIKNPYFIILDQNENNTGRTLDRIFAKIKDLYPESKSSSHHISENTFNFGYATTNDSRPHRIVNGVRYSGYGGMLKIDRSTKSEDLGNKPRYIKSEYEDYARRYFSRIGNFETDNVNNYFTEQGVRKDLVRYALEFAKIIKERKLLG